MNLKITSAKKINDSVHLIVIADKGDARIKHPHLSDTDSDALSSVISAGKGPREIFNKDRFLIYIPIEKKQSPYLTLEQARRSGFEAIEILKRLEISKVAILSLTDADISMAFLEGLGLGTYHFDKYFTSPPKDKKLEEILYLSEDEDHGELERLQIVIEATFLARDLVNEPLSFLSAVQLGKEIEKSGQQSGYKTEVFDKARIQALKMGGLLAVNRGSFDPPTFSILTWNPPHAVNEKPIVLVGKGVVYDTGGLSLKPTLNSMDFMKSDMGGAAAVIGSMYAVARAKLPIHVIALVPSTDNRPGNRAYVPGDVITMYDGTSVEVLNTDAEGRLLLADALSFAQKYDPELVIDFATLTGSAAAAVGPQAVVMMGNADEHVKSALKESSFQVFERLVEFPIWDDYKELLKSDIADIKNVGGRYAGAITAGKFLEHFTDYPWVHFDIAGSAFLKQQDSYRGKNGTGVGVRLTFNYLLNYSRTQKQTT